MLAARSRRACLSDWLAGTRIKTRAGGDAAVVAQGAIKGDDAGGRGTIELVPLAAVQQAGGCVRVRTSISRVDQQPSKQVLADHHMEEDETQQGTMSENLPVPAIVIEEPPEQIEDVAWTYRFLIPTTVAIATLVILGDVMQDFRQVTRKRYKGIEK